MKFIPVNVWILVEKIKEEDKKVGSIYIPNTNEDQQKTSRCKVLAISKDVIVACRAEKKELPYKVGDIIITHSQIGIKYDINDNKDQRYWMKYDAAMAVGKE